MQRNQIFILWYLGTYAVWIYNLFLGTALSFLCNHRPVRCINPIHILKFCSRPMFQHLFRQLKYETVQLRRIGNKIKFSSVSATANICMVYHCVLVSAISLPFILCLWQKAICFNLSFRISHELLCLLFLSNYLTDFMPTKHTCFYRECKTFPF